MSRVLTVENSTGTKLAFKLCRKPDGCLHLHIVNPDETEQVHGEDVQTFTPPDMRTFLEDSVTEVDR
jgi:hypothetical protein